MSYRVETSAYFERRARALLRRYPSLKSELTELFPSLAEQPRQGTELGLSCYKIRLRIKGKGRGKAGSARYYLCGSSGRARCAADHLRQKRPGDDLIRRAARATASA